MERSQTPCYMANQANWSWINPGTNCARSARPVAVSLLSRRTLAGCALNDPGSKRFDLWCSHTNGCARRGQLLYRMKFFTQA
ncbi:hypothetical protein NECAME_09798 [Necator americanus]|uniref:Uncharacterized protein n=1 Tax=Necator americanus TaxID=51031 RepID=W2TEM6_NECAM|nr:hypothetical protein NECAME_09798 [Necator americanus]ETN79462.1 hypothetical protein NECAME_09798 [Necator americanus]